MKQLLSYLIELHVLSFIAKFLNKVKDGLWWNIEDINIFISAHSS